MSRSRFATTSWTLIRAAASDSGTQSHPALATVCQIYWHPVYAFIRRNGHDPDRAQDLTQEFFARLIEKNYLEGADQERGKFRSFLLASVKYFLANENDRVRAVKRGGRHRIVSVDSAEAERWYIPATASEVTPERLFERRWALTVLDRVMKKLRQEYAESGKTAHFENIVVFLMRDSSTIRYELLASKTGLTEGALRMAVYRLKQKYRATLRAEIAQTVDTEADIDSEIQFLMTVLSAE
jgi:DNA-directed RNA polymerase specialized sigma24 family protein